MNINLTLFGQTIGFGLFVLFCMRYVWPPLSKALAERKQRIADGLASAERGQHELEQAKEKANQQLRDAKQQAGEILDQANRRKAEIVDEARQEAKEAANREHAAAESRIEQEVQQARRELRKQVSDLAVLGASRILEREVDANAHNAMLKELADEL